MSPSKMTQRTLRLPPDLWRLAEQATHDRHFGSVNAFLTHCLRNQLDQIPDSSVNLPPPEPEARPNAVLSSDPLTPLEMHVITWRSIFALLDEQTQMASSVSPLAFSQNEAVRQQLLTVFAEQHRSLVTQVVQTWPSTDTPPLFGGAAPHPSLMTGQRRINPDAPSRHHHQYEVQLCQAA